MNILGIRLLYYLPLFSSFSNVNRHKGTVRFIQKQKIIQSFDNRVMRDENF